MEKIYKLLMSDNQDDIKLGALILKGKSIYYIRQFVKKYGSYTELPKMYSSYSYCILNSDTIRLGYPCYYFIIDDLIVLSSKNLDLNKIEKI